MYKLHDAFFTSDRWKTIFDKVAFRTLQMYLETSIFFSLLFAGSLNENTLWNRVSLSWKPRFLSHVWVSMVPPEHSKD